MPTASPTPSRARTPARRRPTRRRVRREARSCRSSARSRRDRSRPTRPRGSSRSARDLAAAEHREHHRRVGRRERRADEAGRRPVEAEQRVRGERDDRRRSRTSRARRARRRDGAPRGSAASPTRMPPSNRITISATTPIRSTVSDREPSPSDGNIVRRAPRRRRRKIAGPGRYASLTRLESTASDEARRDEKHDQAEGADLVHRDDARENRVLEPAYSF